ncbi:Phosphate-specific transport system accessory protein PhoU [Pseudovibrio axinellae]|uniref:Phosphate-specific transport system accessory protein PhoU n=1 Tax=Pseudovibrio axinellae TaxID=989403 RepID=A0A165YJ18_9HYPH|nr:phosphate signaling complex protein PhoU [Pseudovibrio axinellae]KZL18885.1 Phosphate-specific transport system accessory protein PhoU [Pseudovibrio axinellae]SEP89077.1 phosphate uptake regulator, PhoU [Pseudovibrio axinellae]
MKDHIVSSFNEELKELAGRVVEMGGLAETLVHDAVSALLRQDRELAARTIAADQRLDTMQAELEELCISVIARRQPMASDLRDIIAAMRISNDLERVGDMAKNIGKRTLAIETDFSNKQLAVGVEHMSDLALEQLKAVLDSYTTGDLEVVRRVHMRDDEVDALYTSLFRQLLTYMMEDPRSITMCAHLLFCAKNIERIGDHATNIAENIYYMFSGNQLPAERPKTDELADSTSV